MHKVFFCALLVAGLALANVSEVTPALAQDTKDKKTKTTKPAKGTGTIEINKGKDGKYRFNIRNADGKFLGMSGPTGFATEKEARAALDELKEVILNAKITVGSKKPE